MRSRVLVVADELELRARIARALQSAGYTVELAEDINRALKLAAGGTVEAAIVAMSWGPAATTIGRELRNVVPKMIVLADPADEEPNHSLLPADIFRLRPLDEQQLLARLSELMAPRPNPGDNNGPAVVCFEGCRLDLAGRIFVDSGGREVPLTRSEAALLTIFVRSPGRVLSRDQIRRVVAGHGADVFDRSVDMLVRRLRYKIEPNPKVPRFILTVSGAGYKFAARPRNIELSERSPAVIPRTEPDPPTLDRLGQLRDSNDVGTGVPRLGPERRQLTLLCCGLAIVTTLAVDGDLEEIGDIIQSFQHVCMAAIAGMGGSIARSIGEEILALFGYPQAHEDDAERAVQAALDLIARAGEIRFASGAPLQVQTVITTGPVLIDRGQEIIGEPPVLAARLRIATPANSLLITAATRRLIGQAFDLEAPVLHQLDGVSEPVVTYRVTGRRPARTRFEANRTEKLTRFVGRQRELHQLLVLWERATAGNGQVALICGEPGIGKSRICEVFLDHIASEPPITIRCQCSPYHTNSPFHPIIRQLEQAAGFDRQDTSETRLEKLETALSRIGPVSTTDMALYAALLSIPPGDRRLWQELTPRHRKDLTIAMLVRQILTLAFKRPLIIKLADAHWIDSSTHELFGRIIASITAARVLVVVSCRPEFFTHWLENSHVSMLRLNRLEREHARDIVLDVAGETTLPDQICEQIVAKSDGIPLFVEELTKAVLESGLLQGAGGRHVGVDQLLPDTIPVTLADSLMARLDKLGAAKEVAQIGAAIGREFSHRLLAAVAPISPASLRSALARLSSPELIFLRGEPPDSTYIFKHALVRDAAYATLPSRKRRQLHGRIARALEETFPETIQTQPEVIAHHLAQAGLPRQAIDYLQKAGGLAIEQSANAEAIGHLTHAIDLLQSLPEGPERVRSALRLQAMLGQATIAMRGYAAPDTREILLRAKALINDLSDRTAKFAILYGIWAAYYVGGVSSEQKSAAEEFLAAAQRDEDAASLCVAHRLLGTTCLTSGEFTAALGHLERARALYDPRRDAGLRHQYGQDIGAAALCYLSWALWHLGFIDQATKVADAAVRRAEELSHPHTLVYTICHARGLMEIFRRGADDLQFFADRVVSLCTEHGFSHWINYGRIFQGWAAICRGEIGEGIETLRAGVTGWRGTGARLWLPSFLTLEAEAYAKLGRSDAALQAVDHALSVSKETGESK
jgi:DNA-binding response OmpR family regulator/class 3 adenylate cyclase/predicted ATPase